MTALVKRRPLRRPCSLASRLFFSSVLWWIPRTPARQSLGSDTEGDQGWVSNQEEGHDYLEKIQCFPLLFVLKNSFLVQGVGVLMVFLCFLTSSCMVCLKIICGGNSDARVTLISCQARIMWEVEIDLLLFRSFVFGSGIMKILGESLY